jgi:hypothetical protein
MTRRTKPAADPGGRRRPRGGRRPAAGRRPRGARPARPRSARRLVRRGAAGVVRRLSDQRARYAGAVAVPAGRDRPGRDHARGRGGPDDRRVPGRTGRPVAGAPVSLPARYPSLWPAAGARQVIRLEDDRQVAALDAEGRPAVYLPGPAPTSLPTVKRAIADSPAARPFLTGLRLTRPDVVAEVLQIVLPRYDGLDLADLPAAWHDADSARTRPPASRRCCRRPGCTSAARSSRPASRATRRRGSPGTGTGRGWSSCGRWASGRRSRSAPACPARPAS